MTYAIVINLDYDSHTDKTCHDVWNHIKGALLSAGFHCDGRTFSINLDEQAAIALARQTFSDLEDKLAYKRQHLYGYMKDCYGYSIEYVTNLLVPPATNIIVE